MAYSDAPSDPNFAELSAAYLADETTLARKLVATSQLPRTAREKINGTARSLAAELRGNAQTQSMVDAFLQEYALSSDEGVLLMRLAESLIRTPDTDTATLLLRDKLLAGQWGHHFGAKHPIVKLGTAGLALSKSWIQITGGVNAHHLLARLGDRVMLSAVRQAVGLLGRHFVLGTSIENAESRARGLSKTGMTFSYDMLGEAAFTRADAARYFGAYKQALEHLAKRTPDGAQLHRAPALSVKLSALHPRYEYAKRNQCVPELVDRALELCALAKAANLGLTIDAEEAECLEVSLLVFEQLLASEHTDNWDGLGLAIQAYQRRALPVIDWVTRAAIRHHQKITVRLVKGAYWDSEIKRAQELGLDSYPVLTRKEHTDISYLACARKLLEHREQIYPQFATHNAHSAAAVLHMAGDRRDFEFQRLYGMSDGLHQKITDQFGINVRTYAPVGRHKELLPYLVRRLLENGANNSFVNQLLDASIGEDDLVRDPISVAENHGFSPHPNIHAPRDQFQGRRMAASGLDLDQSDVASGIQSRSFSMPQESLGQTCGTPRSGASRAVFSPARSNSELDVIVENAPADIEPVLQACRGDQWSDRDPAHRAQTLRVAADLLQRDKHRLMALCVAEAGKTWRDADAEIREAIDFLRYYADQSERPEVASLEPLGTIACISPWNFPLAIFIGQVSAALAVGNGVVAKPAEQTPLIAIEAVKLLYEAGIPKEALQLVLGDGTIGAALIEHHSINGVCFTGSTATAKRISEALAKTGRGDIALIAETGGINAMIIDSTALLEQAAQDVAVSAFQSAGQRCSACRLVCVQSDIADAFNTMLSGIVADLKIGDPAALDVDLGPVIDRDAQTRISAHIDNMRAQYPIVAERQVSAPTDGTYTNPIAFELNSISDLKEEVFGPVLHIVRYRAEEFESVNDQINALGFGLTMGLHSRIDDRVANVAARAKVGNLYVNRNQIGAVVGVQPFGGHGLSGTGPKAGGPNYLARLCKPTRSSARDYQPTPIRLPGPTGEENTLTHHPRGRLLALGGDTPDVLAKQIDRAEATGNIAITGKTGDLSALIMRRNIDGVIVDGDLRKVVAALLAQRDGAIIPMLSVEDADERFWIEKVLCVNTTASGGNVSLLANI